MVEIAERHPSQRHPYVPEVIHDVLRGYAGNGSFDAQNSHDRIRSLMLLLVA